jgi:hypothetical protein
MSGLPDIGILVRKWRVSNHEAWSAWPSFETPAFATASAGSSG